VVLKQGMLQAAVDASVYTTESARIQAYKQGDSHMDTREDLFESIAQAVIDGDRQACVALAGDVISKGIDPFQAIQHGFTRGMATVGDKFARLEYYLPDVMRCADAVDGGVSVLQPYILEQGKDESAGIVVLGTIKGDLHDLGKNIVATMLRAAGFEVYDLGCDTPVRAYINKAEQVKADIIGVSAILTTTMAYMPDLLSMLEELGLRDRYHVILGGAPVTPSYAEEIGADGYGETAADAVETAQRIMRERRGAR
jgi:corrinoid protein of di/trimethylamine methyltransferase